MRKFGNKFPFRETGVGWTQIWRPKEKTRGSWPHRCGHQPTSSAHHLGVLGLSRWNGGGGGRGLERGRGPDLREVGALSWTSQVLPPAPQSPEAALGGGRTSTRPQIFIKRVTQMPWPRFVYVLGNCCGKENKNHPSICCQVAISAWEGVGGRRKGGLSDEVGGVGQGGEARRVHPSAHTASSHRPCRAPRGAHTPGARLGAGLGATTWPSPQSHPAQPRQKSPGNPEGLCPAPLCGLIPQPPPLPRGAGGLGVITCLKMLSGLTLT